MIQRIIESLARENKIEYFGWTENAFVALFPYYVKEQSGNLSLYARGLDYHKVVKNALKPIAEKFILLGAEKAYIHCDNGEYNDRKAAFDAGLGFYGKNKMLINEELGSYFFIGQVITDLKFEKNEPQKLSCGDCGKCVEACITGVLKGDFDAEKCLSDITQRKGELTDKEKEFIKMGKSCFGCDACQRVCPYNSFLETNSFVGFLNDRILSLKSLDLEGLSERKFKEKFGNYAFAWRGKKVLQRNLEILENKDE